MEYYGACNIARVTGALEGTLAANHVMRGETIYTGKIAIARTSGALDLLPVSVPGRLLDGVFGTESVSIRAQVRSYNIREAEANRLAITLFARYIEDAPPDAPPENDVALVGALCKRAIFRTTPFLREIADLLIAVNRAYGRSDYIPCIAWGREAHMAAELLPGTHLRVTGRLQSREYTKRFPEGGEEQRTAYELSCRTLEIL